MDKVEPGRVLVAGAGIAGLALTRLLHGRGVPVSTFERRETSADAGLAINLPGNAVAALARMGLQSDLERHGAAIGRREYRTSRDRLLFQVDEDAFWGEDARPRCVRRSDLLAVLNRGVPAETVRRGAAVDAVTRADVDVLAHLSDATTQRGRLLVGADGVGSTVRGGLPGVADATAAVLADASWRFMAPNLGVDCWTLWAGRGGMILLIPVDAGEVYGWATIKAADMSGGSLELDAAWFADFPRVVRRTLEALGGSGTAALPSPLREVRTSNWCGDGVVLIGDAAHATAPVWAQGAALAFEDAETLADLLCARKDWQTVGADFERIRRPRVAHVQKATDRMSRAARLPAWLSGLLLPFAGPRSYSSTYGPLRGPLTGSPQDPSGG